MDPPRIQLHCYGSHLQYLTTITPQGRAKTSTKKIVDFDFLIDLALSMNRGSGELYTLRNNVMAHRGKMEKEVGTGGPQCLRDWARIYAESSKTGKKFKFYKVRQPIPHCAIY